jgi:hypothetical protein
MSEDILHRLTLEYLVNKQYNKNNISSQYQCKPIRKKEQRFYKKRIINITRELLMATETDEFETTDDIKHAFNTYIKTCVEYFKTTDMSDILQEDYKNDTENLLATDANDDTECPENSFLVEDTKRMMKRMEREKNTLDTFVTNLSQENGETVITTMQKKINIKDPILRNKGIRKRKNIPNNYESVEFKEEVYDAVETTVRTEKNT